jgi:hypothetical protein
MRMAIAWTFHDSRGASAYLCDIHLTYIKVMHYIARL